MIKISENEDDILGRFVKYSLLDETMVKNLPYGYAGVNGQACFRNILYVNAANSNSENGMNIWIYNMDTGQEKRLKYNVIPRYYGPFLSVHRYHE